MAKQSNILIRSKRVENNVQRYLWPGTSRAWKERWDVGAFDEEGDWLCIGEVKSRKAGGLCDIWTKLSEALDQAEDVAPHEECWCFAVLLPPSTRVCDAFVMYRPWGLHGSENDYDGTKVVMTLEQFSGVAFVREAEAVHSSEREVAAEVTSGEASKQV